MNIGVKPDEQTKLYDEIGKLTGWEREQTNKEWIQSATTEQLAYVLMKIFVTRTFCHLCPEGDVCDIGYKCKYSEGKKIEDWELWLKNHTPTRS